MDGGTTQPPHLREADPQMVRWLQKVYDASRGWSDVGSGLGSAITTGIGVPSLVQINGSPFWGREFTDQGSEGTEKRLLFQPQLPHFVRRGTEIRFHIHYAIGVAPATDQNVSWEVTYGTLNRTGVSLSSALSTTKTVNMPISSDLQDYAYHVDQLAVIVNDDIIESTIFAVTIRRKSSTAADTYTGQPIYLLSGDGHAFHEKNGTLKEFPGALLGQ